MEKKKKKKKADQEGIDSSFCRRTTKILENTPQFGVIT